MTKKSNNFTQDLAELEAIVAWFESEEVDLEQALEKFERGLVLSDALKQRLEDMENKVINLRETYTSEDTTTDNPAASK